MIHAPNASSTLMHAAERPWLNRFVGLAPVATNVVTPIVTWFQVQKKPIPESTKKSIVIQESVRQVISAAIQIVTYFGGGWLVKRLFAGASRSSEAAIIGGTIASFIGYAFVRPVISTELIVAGLKRFGVVDPPQPANLSAPQARAFRPESAVGINPLRAEQRRQEFFGRIQARMQFSAQG